jgi:hypothetical protein
MFNKLVFNSENQLVLASNIIPDSHTGPEYTIIELKDGEVFDPQYTYSLVDGKAVKGDLYPVDEELELEFQRTEYQRLRAPEYPSIADQLDMIWHGIDAGTLDTSSTFYNKLKEIKDKYPKPE